MKKYIILFLLAISGAVGYGQNNVEYKDYELWYMYQKFYNNYMSDSTEAYYWENYWYYSTNEKKRFPDTLVVALKAEPSMAIWDYNSMPTNEYKVKSTLEFKYGNHDNCFLVVNPRYSDKYVLMDTILNYGSLYDMVKNNGGGFLLLKVAKLPMLEILRKLRICVIEPGEDELIEEGAKALNQIIITTQVVDKNDKVCQIFEFTLPVSGCYDNESEIRKWDF
ncbi:MAG: hypothetical protein J6V33_07785 [Bacteroidales bacterium]|nr:hypothetical protein [Bacteroidales bacterium]